jgi:hypothetical protein
MKRLSAGAIGGLVLVVLSLVFDFVTYPIFASYGFKMLTITDPLFYFVTTAIISFGIGMACSLLYIMLRGHIPYDGLEKGLVYGLFLWCMVEAVKAAQVIAYTRLPTIYSVVWMLEGLIKYCAYGGVIYILLEPHAHLWPHPDLLKIARPRRDFKKTSTKPAKTSRRK